MWPCHAPQGYPTLLKKSIFFIDHKLLVDEGILKNIKLLLMPYMGVVLPRPSGWQNWKNLETLIDHKPPLDGERML